MERKSEVTFGPKEWEILHTYDEDLIEKMCYLERMSGQNGFSEDRSHRSICHIPRHRLYSDLELIKYQQLKGKDDAEAKRQFEKWLLKNPQFKCCNGGI